MEETAVLYYPLGQLDRHSGLIELVKKTFENVSVRGDSGMETVQLEVSSEDGYKLYAGSTTIMGACAAKEMPPRTT